jgi:hypothetical protein
MRIRSYSPYILAGILVTATILRLNHITQPFIDYASWRETSTAMMADNYYRHNWNIFYPAVNWNGPEPSYQGREFQTVTYIAALLYVVIGQHDWIGRGIAVVFGVWGIFALYQLVRRVWDEDLALASAAVMALLPGSIFVERSFLPDPAMVSLVVTSVWMLVTYCQTEQLRYLIIASLIGSWGFLTKLPGLIIGIPMLYAVFAILGKKALQPKKLLTIGVAAVVTIIPVIAYYLWARHLALTYPPYHFAGGGNWLWDDGLSNWLDKKYFLPALYWNFNRWIWTKPFILLVVVGLFAKLPTVNCQSKDNDFQAPWLFHWWMIALAIYYFIGAKELVINAWNFHLINPAASALAGHALITIGSWINSIVVSFSGRLSKRRSLAGLTAVLLILMFVGGYGQKNLKKMYYPPEAHWNATESYKLGLALSKISAPQDLVVTIANDIGEPVMIYYSKRRGWVFPPPGEGIIWWSEISADDLKLIKVFEKLRLQGADWFGIVDEHRKELLENKPIFMKHIEKSCDLVRASPYGVIYHIKSSLEN